MIHVIDEFFEAPENIRDEALHAQYRHSSDVPGVNWVGHRSNQLPSSVMTEFIKNQTYHALKMASEQMDYYWHYTTEGVNLENKWHTDDEYDYSGLVFLNEAPPANTGTEFDQGQHSIDNKWNRYVIWNSGIEHAIENTFGTDIEDSRLTLIFFVRL